MLCRKCGKKIPKKEAVWKTRTPIWNHTWPHARWWWYSGYFCKNVLLKQVGTHFFCLLFSLCGWLYFFLLCI